MQQKLLRKAGLLGLLATALGFFIAGCVDEPNPPVYGEVDCTVRFVHAISDAQAVDIWIDGAKVVSNLSYKGSTAQYLSVHAGNRFVRLLPAGSTDTSQAIFRQMTSFRSFTKITAVFYGLQNSGTLALLQTQERFTYSDETKKLVDSSDVKVINVNESQEKVVLADGSASGPTLIGPVDVYSLSPYMKLKAGAYTFFVVTEGGVEMKSFDFTIDAKNRYSFIVVGDLATPDVLLLKDDPQ